MLKYFCLAGLAISKLSAEKPCYEYDFNTGLEIPCPGDYSNFHNYHELAWLIDLFPSFTPAEDHFSLDLTEIGLDFSLLINYDMSEIKIISPFYSEHFKLTEKDTGMKMKYKQNIPFLNQNLIANMDMSEKFKPGKVHDNPKKSTLDQELYNLNLNVGLSQLPDLDESEIVMSSLLKMDILEGLEQVNSLSHKLEYNFNNQTTLGAQNLKISMKYHNRKDQDDDSLILGEVDSIYSFLMPTHLKSCSYTLKTQHQDNHEFYQFHNSLTVKGKTTFERIGEVDDQKDSLYEFEILGNYKISSQHENGHNTPESNSMYGSSEVNSGSFDLQMANLEQLVEFVTFNLGENLKRHFEFLVYPMLSQSMFSSQETSGIYQFIAGESFSTMSEPFKVSITLNGTSDWSHQDVVYESYYDHSDDWSYDYFHQVWFEFESLFNFKVQYIFEPESEPETVFGIFAEVSKNGHFLHVQSDSGEFNLAIDLQKFNDFVSIFETATGMNLMYQISRQVSKYEYFFTHVFHDVTALFHGFISEEEFPMFLESRIASLMHLDMYVDAFIQDFTLFLEENFQSHICVKNLQDDLLSDQLGLNFSDFWVDHMILADLAFNSGFPYENMWDENGNMTSKAREAANGYFSDSCHFFFEGIRYSLSDVSAEVAGFISGIREEIRKYVSILYNGVHADFALTADQILYVDDMMLSENLYYEVQNVLNGMYYLF